MQRCLVLMSVKFNIQYYMEMSCSVMYLTLVMTATTGRPNCEILVCTLDQHFCFTKHGVLHILHAAIGDELLESLQIYIIMKTEHFHTVYTIYKITKMRTECLPFPSFPSFGFDGRCGNAAVLLFVHLS